MSHSERFVEGAGDGSAARRLLTLLGAAALIVGAFLKWVGDAVGTSVTAQSFVDPGFTRSNFVSSAGLVMIVLGVVALLGLLLRTGWLTALAGGLAVVAFALFVVNIYRSEANIGDLGIGLWVCLAGGIAALLAGFVRKQRPRMG